MPSAHSGTERIPKAHLQPMSSPKVKHRPNVRNDRAPNLRERLLASTHFRTLAHSANDRNHLDLRNRSYPRRHIAPYGTDLGAHRATAPSAQKNRVSGSRSRH